MSVLSKVINSQLKNYSCRTLLHPGLTCTQSTIQNLIHYFPSNAKFFLPVVLISLLMKFKKMNRKIFFDCVSYYLELVFGAYIIGNLITVSVCLMRQAFGKFDYYTVVLLPTLFANIICFILPNRVSRIFTVTVYEVLIEAQFRKKSNIITRAIGESKILQTFLFMICSSTILPILKNNNKTKVFWFMQSLKSSCDEQIVTEKCDLNLNIENNNKLNLNSKCHHNESCLNFLNQGIKSYFLIGFALESAKMIFSKSAQKSNGFRNIFLNKLRNFNISTIQFLVSYVGLYRGSNCLLNKFFDMNSETIHVLSSFIGGISYIFCPKPTFLAYAITISAELLWRQLSQKKHKSELMKKISKLNISRVICLPALALILHFYVFQNHLVNNLGAGLANAATNHKATEVRHRLVAILNGYQLK